MPQTSKLDGGIAHLLHVTNTLRTHISKQSTYALFANVRSEVANVRSVYVLYIIFIIRQCLQLPPRSNITDCQSKCNATQLKKARKVSADSTSHLQATNGTLKMMNRLPCIKCSKC